MTIEEKHKIHDKQDQQKEDCTIVKHESSIDIKQPKIMRKNRFQSSRFELFRIC